MGTCWPLRCCDTGIIISGVKCLRLKDDKVLYKMQTLLFNYDFIFLFNFADPILYTKHTQGGYDPPSRRTDRTRGLYICPHKRSAQGRGHRQVGRGAGTDDHGQRRRLCIH